MVVCTYILATGMYRQEDCGPKPTPDKNYRKINEGKKGWRLGSNGRAHE
jgi:hypothetical protein